MMIYGITTLSIHLPGECAEGALFGRWGTAAKIKLHSVPGGPALRWSLVWPRLRFELAAIRDNIPTKV